MNNIIFSRLQNAEKIIIGLSGGADSIALTHILLQKFGSEKLLVAHINHGIRGNEAKRDEFFVKEFCDKFKIKSEFLHVDIPKIAKEKGIGEEECGRIVRYDFFSSLCTESDLIATAHNADDNAETVLLNLVRGTGVKGLCGIPSQRENITRPILDMTRAEIEKYCSDNSLKYVTDSTNNENDYSRNKVRNLVLPLLREINSAASENIARSSDIMNDVFDYINSEAENILNKAIINESLDCKILQSYDEYILSEVISLFLQRQNIKNYEKKHITKAVELIFSSGAVVLPNEMIISVKQNLLSVFQIDNYKLDKVNLKINQINDYFGKKIEIFEKNSTLQPKINKKLFNTLIDCDTIKGCLTAGGRIAGDYFYPYGRNVRKSLKKLFNEAKIPSHLRDKLVVIRDDENIVFIENFGVSSLYAVNENTKNIISVEIKT